MTSEQTLILPLHLINFSSLCNTAPVGRKVELVKFGLKWRSTQELKLMTFERQRTEWRVVFFINDKTTKSISFSGDLHECFAAKIFLLRTHNWGTIQLHMGGAKKTRSCGAHWFCPLLTTWLSTAAFSVMDVKKVPHQTRIQQWRISLHRRIYPLHALFYNCSPKDSKHLSIGKSTTKVQVLKWPIFQALCSKEIGFLNRKIQTCNVCLFLVWCAERQCFLGQSHKSTFPPKEKLLFLEVFVCLPWEPFLVHANSCHLANKNFFFVHRYKKIQTVSISI